MSLKRFFLCSAVPLTLTAAANAQETPIVLDPIIVGSGLSNVASETPQSISVITQEAIEREQPTTVGDLFTDVPGVSVFGSEQILGQQFNIRGIGTGQDGDQNSTITRIDGVQKFYQQYRMGALFTEPELFRRIEVLRGPASSTLTGAGAVGGVIELETKDASDFLDGPGDRFGGRQKFQYDSNGDGFLSSTILAGQPADNLELLAFFAYRERDDLEDADGDDIIGTNFDLTSYLLKGRYTFGNDLQHSVFATFQNFHTEEDGANYEQTGFNEAFGFVDREVDDNLLVLGYDFNPVANDLIDLELRFGYSDTEVIQTDPEGSPFSAFSVLFEDAEYGYESWQFSAINTSLFSVGETDVTLSTGFDVSRQNRTAKTTSFNNFTTPPNGFIAFQPGGLDDNLGVFAQAEIVTPFGLTIIPGVRYEFQELEPDSINTTFDTSDTIENTAFAPKLALLYEITDEINVFGTYAQTERLPVLDEAFDGNSGNLDLEPEQARTWELGASYSGLDVFLNNDQLVGKVVYFNSEIEDLIDRPNTANAFVNLPESEIDGWEVEASYDSDFVFGRLAYTRIRGEGTSVILDGNGNTVEGDKDNLSDIPADELSVTLGGRVPRYDLEVSARGTFTSRQDQVPDGADETPGYQVYDIFGSWIPSSGILEGAEVRVAALNVFNEDYSPALFVGDPSVNRAAGRSFRLSLAYRF